MAAAGSAYAQQRVSFDYLCGPTVAAATPSGLPTTGWQRADDGQLLPAAGNPCWLRVDVARFMPQVLAVYGPRDTDLVVYAADGKQLAAASYAVPRDRAIGGAGYGFNMYIMFPTLREGDSPVLLRVQRTGRVNLSAIESGEG